MDDPVLIMRMLERLIVVLFGGFAIYLGYRLFFHIPLQNNHKGELTFPGVKIVLSRVGPGIFFAAFGTGVLLYSLTHGIEVNNPDGEFSGMGPRAEAQKTTGDSFVTGISPQQRSKTLTTIEMLNCAGYLLEQTASSPDLQQQMALALRDAKRALMISVWEEDIWGSIQQLGIVGPAPDASSEVRTTFNSVYKKCPS